VANDADFVAASFIRSASHVQSVIAHLERCCDEVAGPRGAGARPMRPLVISKIENAEGVADFVNILEASDGIMVRWALPGSALTRTAQWQ
jgi:pyruvate kinase